MNSGIQLLYDSLSQRIASFPALAGLDLLSLARPSVRLATQRVRYGRIELGETRIGGIPDLPADFEWPRWKPAKPTDKRLVRPSDPTEPAPLGFIAQIDLEAIPRVDDSLPTVGWFYFFYDRYCERWGFDPADRGCCRILYLNCSRTSLIRTEPPADANPEHKAEACLVEAWPELTLPDRLQQIKYKTPAYDAYEAISDELVKGKGTTQHRLLGNPQLVQNPLELECQLASNGVYCGTSEGYQSKEAKDLAPGASEWQLLLQIDTDEVGPGWMWGDVGRIYFCVKKSDLRSLRFIDAWLIFQCY